jgi:hypothetical protein
MRPVPTDYSTGMSQRQPAARGQLPVSDRCHRAGLLLMGDLLHPILTRWRLRRQFTLCLPFRYLVWGGNPANAVLLAHMRFGMKPHHDRN